MVKTHVEVISCLEEQRSGEKLLSFKGESHSPGSCASMTADLRSRSQEFMCAPASRRGKRRHGGFFCCCFFVRMQKPSFPN